MTQPDTCPVCKEKGKPSINMFGKAVSFLCKKNHKWRVVNEKQKNGETKLGHTKV